MKKCANRIEVMDITEEYNNYCRNDGKVVCENGYICKIHLSELKSAQWLNSKFGGEVKLLKENTQYAQKTPDYLWRGSAWELKEISSNKFDTIDKRIRKAYEQIRNNRGGMLLDFSGSSLGMSSVKDYVIKSLQARAHGVADIIVKKGDEYIVLRAREMSVASPDPILDQDATPTAHTDYNKITIRKQVFQMPTENFNNHSAEEESNVD